MEPTNKKNLLIGCTGSVATIRVDEIIKAFKNDFNLKIILTKNAKVFSDILIKDYQEYKKLHGVEIYFDEDEYEEYRSKDIVLHIETCVIRAWDFSKPGFFNLAMNTNMYEHFITEKQVKVMTDEFRFIHIPSAVKKLKCGDVGIGGIADTEVIYTLVYNKMYVN